MKQRKSLRITEEQVHVWMTTLRELIRRDVRALDTSDMYSSCDMEDIWSDCLKKLCNPKQSTECDLAAYAKFQKVNDQLASVNLKQFTDRDPSQKRGKMNFILSSARYWCREILGPLQLSEWFESCKHSGGVSLGVPYSDTSLERKLKGPISVTHEAKSLFKLSLAYNPRLWAAVMNHNGLSREFSSESFDKITCLEHSSRATTVPKTEKIARMIAIEPTGNMYLQQGLMRMMYKRLSSVGLDVRSLPEQHVELARLASIDGSLATIDFSSASDCVSIDLVDFLLPTEWSSALHKIRCKSMSINGSETNLNMISTMGNATTFPLETLVFYSLARATEQWYTNRGVLPDLSRKQRPVISVFGDDCIVPTEIARDFMSSCESVGLIVNREKSFFSPGPGFRESCGGDFLHGVDVRPLYFKWPSSLKGSGLKAWLYNIFNNLSKKYILYFGDCSYIYKRALQYLAAKIKACRETYFIPSFFPSDAGLYIDDVRIISMFETHKDPRVSKHGVVEFLYLRFLYFEVRDTNQELRLLQWLDKHRNRRSLSEHPLRGSDPFYSTRSRGSYVVAKAWSAHWVPG